MTLPKPSGVVNTNEVAGSVAKAQHSEPSVRLLGRIAADWVGHIGRLGSGKKSDLHFTLLISDAYSGTLAFDGQPSLDASFKPKNPLSTFDNFTLIKTRIYVNEIPKGVLLEINIDPPLGMSRTLFAQELARKACAFASYVLDYSFPEKWKEPVMIPGEYNSSSYMAGLLNSVIGHVPSIRTPGYQTPGWDTPIPSSYFKGEAMR